MKENFSLSLTGKDWWKPFLLYVVLTLATVIPLELALMGLDETRPGAYVASALLFVLVMLVLVSLIQAVFTVVLCRIAYPAVTFRGKAFAFTGKIDEFCKLTLGQILLVIVTLGIYFPWYTKRITDYIARHSEYDGEPARFFGTGGKLFKYFLLALVIPVMVWACLFAVIVGIVTFTAGSNAGIDDKILFIGLTVVVYFLIFFVMIPFLYLSYKWYFNLAWKGLRVSWDTEFWPSCFFIAGQVFLTIVTLGIYWPALQINAWRYFAGKTVVLELDTERGRFGFEGKTGKGFGLLWGQTLLSIVTLGVYSPWAYAKCARYFANNLFFEETQGRIAQNDDREEIAKR